MASLSNMKFYYVVVMDGYKLVEQIKCLTVKEANTLLAEKKKEYSSAQYAVSKEHY